MEFVGLIVGALLALGIALLLSRGDRPRRAARAEPAPGDVRRVSRLCAGLTGDPDRDRPLLNRILALGPDVIPALLGELTALNRVSDELPPERQARIEEVIADFGLAAVPPVTDMLARLQPTAPLTPSLMRVLQRLGAPGLRAVVSRATQTPDLAPFLPRFSHLVDPADEPAQAIFGALRTLEPTRRGLALDVTAGLMIRHPEVLTALWQHWDASGRATLLDWLADWLPFAEASLVIEGLGDADRRVRFAAARLCTLLGEAVPDSALVGALADPDPAVRQAVLRALGARSGESTVELIAPAALDAEPAVAVEALTALAARPGVALSGALPPHAASDGFLAAVRAGEVSLERVLGALDDPHPPVRRLAALLAARDPADPRGRERLIRQVDGPDVQARCTAVLALARVGDPIAGDLLVRVLRSDPPPVDVLDLQEAAQRVGAAVAPALARRLRPDPPARVTSTLAVLRCIPREGAAPVLLRGLEDARSGAFEGQLAATLAAGGPEVREAIGQALRQPTRGLLAPALRFLTSHGDPADVPLLLDLYERHPPLRKLVLTLIEGMGAPAIASLERRIAEGGDDVILADLEQRHALLVACFQDSAG